VFLHGLDVVFNIWDMLIVGNYVDL
jgi:hypothetical protein